MSDAGRKIIESVPYLSPRHAGILGLFSLSVFIVCWIIGAWVDEEWVLFDDSVCRLGVSDITFIRVMYPIDCTVSGLGLGYFGYCIARSSKRKLQTVGYDLCVPFGLALMGIGLVNIDMNYTLHMVFVFAMAIFGGFVIGLTAIDDFRNGDRFTLPYFIIIMAVFLYLTFFNFDYQQPFVYVCMFIWLIYKCYFFIRDDSVN